MADEVDMSDPTPELSKKNHIVDPFAKLTERDWINAMEVGRQIDEARDAMIRKAIKGGD